MTAWVLLVALLLAGCAQPRPRVEPALRHPTGLPDTEAVASAVARLAEAVREELDQGDEDRPRGWPSHLPRSRDFPELPLARVATVEDLGKTGADLEGLTRAVEQELRRARLVRLSVDEEAVPGWLREEPGAPPARGAEHRKPGLLVKGWTDRAGRLVLELDDLVIDETVARARSR